MKERRGVGSAQARARFKEHGDSNEREPRPSLVIKTWGVRAKRRANEDLPPSGTDVFGESCGLATDRVLIGLKRAVKWD